MPTKNTSHYQRLVHFPTQNPTYYIYKVLILDKSMKQVFPADNEFCFDSNTNKW